MCSAVCLCQPGALLAVPSRTGCAVLCCARHCHGFRCCAACVAFSGSGLIFKYAEACKKPASALLILLSGDIDSGLKCVCFSFSCFLRFLILSCKTNMLPASVKVEAHICQWIETQTITDIISLKPILWEKNDKKNIVCRNGKLRLWQTFSPVVLLVYIT